MRTATDTYDNVEGVTMEIVYRYSVQHGAIEVQDVAEITSGVLRSFHDAKLEPGEWMERERVFLNRRLLNSMYDMSGFYSRAVRICSADYQRTRKESA